LLDQVAKRCPETAAGGSGRGCCGGVAGSSGVPVLGDLPQAGVAAELFGDRELFG
jgi:hypothetical protein